MNMNRAQNQQIVKGKNSSGSGSSSSRRSENKGMIKRSSKKEAFRVVYISTPMKVTICASKFREIVQQLTGPESDVARFMEGCGGSVYDHHDDGRQLSVNDYYWNIGS